MMKLKNLKNVHFTGIKGVGMTALALYFRDMGINVTGSDIDEVFVTDEILKRNNIDWKVGFEENNISANTDLVVVTAAHAGLLNPEVQSANKKNIPVLTYAEVLAEVGRAKDLIGVCGVGGKTTTSSMISVLLDTAGLHPSFVIGVADIFPLGRSGRFDRRGKHFVCEADDYVVSPGIDNRPKFMLLTPKVVVVTNIEYDHPDIYKNFDETKKAFASFFEKIPKNGMLVACIDNPNVLEVLRQTSCPVTTYGYSPSSDCQVKNVVFNNGKTHFDLYFTKRKELIKGLSINVLGRFNVLNATAAYLVGKFIGINSHTLHDGLASYGGCRRRFEFMGERGGISFYDDYAHHPEEIKSTLDAVKTSFPNRRIVTIFQPHTYSRTKALFDEFSKAFKNTDVIGLMDIYASAREGEDNTVSSKKLSQEIAKFHSESYYLGDHKSTLKWIKSNIKKGDLFVTMGAGDIFHLYNELKLKR